jgi:hypothetical protein
VARCARGRGADRCRGSGRISAAADAGSQTRVGPRARSNTGPSGVAASVESASACTRRAVPGLGTPRPVARLRSRPRTGTGISRPAADTAVHARWSIPASVPATVGRAEGPLGRKPELRGTDPDSRASARRTVVARIRRCGRTTVLGAALRQGDGKSRASLAAVAQLHAHTCAWVLRVPDRRHELQHRRRLSRRAVS